MENNELLNNTMTWRLILIKKKWAFSGGGGMRIRKGGNACRKFWIQQETNHGVAQNFCDPKKRTYLKYNKYIFLYFFVWNRKRDLRGYILATCDVVFHTENTLSETKTRNLHP